MNIPLASSNSRSISIYYGSEFRWIFVKTTDAGSYMLEAFTLVYDNGHMSLEGACHSVQPLDVRV